MPHLKGLANFRLPARIAVGSLAYSYPLFYKSQIRNWICSFSAIKQCPCAVLQIRIMQLDIDRSEPFILDPFDYRPWGPGDAPPEKLQSNLASLLREMGCFLRHPHARGQESSRYCDSPTEAPPEVR